MKRHITTVAGMMLAAIILFLVLGGGTAYAATNAKVSVPVLNVRLGPGTGYKKITYIKVGQTYPVVDSKNGWYKLKIGSTLGWVCGDYVQTSSTGVTAPPAVQTPGPSGGTSVADSITVNVSLLNVRSGNSVKTSIIGGVKKGATYTILDSKAGWYKISYNSAQGWISGDYVTVNYKEDEQDQETPKQPEATNVYEVQDIRFLKTDTRNCIAIPVNIKVSKNDTSVISAPSPSVSTAADGKVIITVQNSTYNGINKDIAITDNVLLSSVNIANVEPKSTVFTLTPISNLSYEVYTVQAKGSEDNDYKYYNYYVVVSMKNAVNTSDNTGSGNNGNEAAVNSQGKTKKDYVIALDAGHGGTTSGAVNNGLEEKVFNMDVINKLNNILKAQGYDIYLTRSSDTYVSLADRADSANILKSDIFVSVHLNSYPSPSVSGTETLYNSSIPTSGAVLAEMIQKNLVTDLNRVNRGIKNRPDLYVLNSTNMPAALAELVFMSNTDELNLICGEETRQKAAESMAKAINEYFGFAN